MSDYYNYNNQMNRRDFIAVSALSLTSILTLTVKNPLSS